MSISLDSLEAFVIAAEAGSFTQAARRLGKAQSTISTLIGNLEIDWGVDLFDRSGKYPVLTQVGHAMLADTRLAVAQMRGLGNRADLLSGTQGEALTLYCDEQLPIPFIFNIIDEFAKLFPNSELSLFGGSPEDVIQALEKKEAHIAVGGFTSMSNPDWINIRHAGIQEFVTIVAEGHPLARLSHVTAEDLAMHMEIAIAGMNPLTSPYSSTKRWFANSYFVMAELAARGIGWARVPKDMINDFITRTVIFLNGDEAVAPVRQPFQIATRKDAFLGQAGQWLIDRIAQD